MNRYEVTVTVHVTAKDEDAAHREVDSFLERRLTPELIPARRAGVTEWSLEPSPVSVTEVYS